MAEIPTIHVRFLSDGHEARINESDFNDELHAPFFEYVRPEAGSEGEGSGQGSDEKPAELSAKDTIALVAEADAEKLAALEAAENGREAGARKTVAKAIEDRRAALAS
jgi:hypothetical protein